MNIEKQMKNIIKIQQSNFWEPNILKMSEQEYFINFYSADGIISTYSSVCLEAAHNITLIGLNYNPKEYGLKVRDNWFHKITDLTHIEIIK